MYSLEKVIKNLHNEIKDYVNSEHAYYQQSAKDAAFRLILRHARKLYKKQSVEQKDFFACLDMAFFYYIKNNKKNINEKKQTDYVKYIVDKILVNNYSINMIKDLLEKINNKNAHIANLIKTNLISVINTICNVNDFIMKNSVIKEYSAIYFNSNAKKLLNEIKLMSIMLHDDFVSVKFFISGLPTKAKEDQ